MPFTAERANGDILLQWGEYFVVVPPTGPARHLDLRSVFERKMEFSGRLARPVTPFRAADRNADPA